ncbi:methyltransferase domain-containing protein [Marinobacterium mangrovicola]|uniref:2-polyprenyl-3-methyl-5-hydroxy-6-metoxy-1, 4-benzoquinol methylase n=1 Tax=Marinobacterium mangrovicola TaxID=1476959 RepID=A0A4R1GFF1_9GAMM|nr:methyltransferase domain-containing protein [Marinobacterium mangrovicola]TCK07127.1 2-polyprenyl-3-methyl-5-hydroxy-6-metoxy-1,4-benzoquinol methylase [Marinobacterium mangrovicola]
MYRVKKTEHNWLYKKIINKFVFHRLSSINGLVLDFGCGLCPFKSDILGVAEGYVGIDWSDTLHSLRADIIADLNKKIPIKSACADHIVSFEVLEHLSEPMHMLNEAFRILKNGGEITISVPFQHWVHEAPWDYYRFTRYGLYYLLQKAGYVDVHIQHMSGFWSMWLMKLNYQTKRLVRGPNFFKLMMRIILVPFWWLNQNVGPILDRFWFEDRETIGYFVTARKP